MALAGNYLWTAIRGYSNIAAFAERDGDLHTSAGMACEAEELSRRLGSRRPQRWARANRVGVKLALGEWDECGRIADEIISQAETQEPHYLDAMVYAARARLRLARDRIQAAVEDQAAGLACARRVKDPQVLYAVLGLSVYILADAGRPDDGRDRLNELTAAPATEAAGLLSDACPLIALAAQTVGRSAELRSWLGSVVATPWISAARSILDDDFLGALATLEATGAIYTQSLIRLHAAQRLASDGRRSEAEEILQPALTFFQTVGATRYLRAADALLAA